MAEYITKEALRTYPIRENHCDKEHANEHFIRGIESVMEYAEGLPAADVAPVVHGRWDGSGKYTFPDGKTAVRCSECGCALTNGEYLMFNWNYCPVCGAKMDAMEEHGFKNCTTSWKGR